MTDPTPDLPIADMTADATDMTPAVPDARAAGTAGRLPGIAHEARDWASYVALGDSFTEGMSDPDPQAGEGEYRGWADRLAAMLAAERAQRGLGFGYANLAVRGRLLDDIVGPQLDAALELRPTLVSIVGGGNDILRPRADIDALAARLEEAVVRLRASGADVLLTTPTDPAGAPLVSATRGRVGIYIAHIMTIAQTHGCYLLNQWGLRALQDWRMWSQDRIHMTPEGHRRVALAAFEALGHQASDAGYRAPLAPEETLPSRRERLQAEATWAREFVAPWVHRRLTGRSSGDGREGKRPTLSQAPPTPEE